MNPDTIQVQEQEEEYNILQEFLEEKGLVDVFTRYAKNYDTLSLDEINEFHKSRAIINSFGWANTPEGFDFWDNLDNEYCTYYRSNK